MSDKTAQFCPECGRSTLSWCPEFADRVDAAEHRTDAAEELARSAEVRAKELEAQCAAMREALESLWAAVGDRLLAKGPLSREYANSVQSGIKAALSGDAGRALRDRVEALERVAGAARVVKKHGYFGDDASNLDAAVDIVDALEPKR